VEKGGETWYEQRRGKNTPRKKQKMRIFQRSSNHTSIKQDGRLVYYTGRKGKKNQASNEEQQEGDLDG